MTATSIDPIAASDRVERDYRSYLASTFSFADASLRHDLETRLTEPGRVRRGPILQAAPPYRPGATLTDLVEDGVLHPGLLERDDDKLPADRPLYVHQEQAIRATRHGRNLVIATGTGSGKTECYLLPVLDHLLRERDAGTLRQPGVRALLLYPMNALANDQMQRIRDLFAPYPDITFGRYVGDTEHTRERAVARYRQQHGTEPLPNELVDRDAMKATPPHVLLTNYAMLEYLLLRPADSPFFDGTTGAHWRFVVLDEVHVYDGARGTELGMLLRRVRDRVRGSKPGVLQCIATSATLGRGTQDAPAVANYASDLFDEEFTTEDVVHPDRLPLGSDDARWALTPAALERLHTAWVTGEPAEQLLATVGDLSGDAGVTPTGDRNAVLHSLLAHEHHVVELQRALEARSVDLADISTVMETFRHPQRTVVQLVELGIAARPDSQSAPLIPARYHLFLRASEGAYVCWSPHHPAAEPRIVLDRHEHCPTCLRSAVTSQMFELAICRLCGIDYMIGQLEDGDGVRRLTHAAAHQRSLVHVLRERGNPDAAVDEDEEAVSGSVDDQRLDHAYLCTGCGALGDTQVCPCGCRGAGTIAVFIANTKKGDELRRCVACGRHSTASVTLRFLSGSEAPVSVVATSLYQSLPPLTTTSRRASANGRKLLMFSDSRQDAAFFAPYLQRTYTRAVERRLLWSLLRDDPEPFRVDDLLPRLRRRAEDVGVLDEDRGRTNTDDALTWLLAELLATDRRQSLDGVGLAEIVPRIPRKLDPLVSLRPLNLDEDDAFDVLRLLLDSVRHGAAVGIPDGVDVRDDPHFAPRNTSTRLREAGSENGVLAWLPGRGLNRRLDLVEKIVAAKGVDVDGRALLTDLWREITEADSPLRSVLVARDVPRLGTVFTLDAGQIEFIARSAAHQPYRCDQCRQLWWRSVASVCPTYRCRGSLVPADEVEPNHYRSLYEGLEPIPLVVEEHTGQLRTQRASELQQKFVDGEVNALSCSTTFELGVDVGDVQAVLMRNVPPSSANYVQRAGRAGRRLDTAALVVTFAQRRSHDLHFFEHPGALVDGHVRPPIVVMDNEAIVRRHVHAVAWSMFERGRVDANEPEAHQVQDLVLPQEGATLANRFLDWLATHPSQLAEHLGGIVPPRVAEDIDIRGWTWVDRLSDPDADGVGGWLTSGVAEVRDDLDELAKLEAKASSEGKHKWAHSLQRTRRTLAERRVLDFLARTGVLPKYGFPVDVVDLDLSRSQEATANVELTRDLKMAILEFAPGARVVAANHLWVSKGIRQSPGKDLPMYEWGICEGCGVLRSQVVTADTDRDEVLVDPCAHCGSELFASGQRGRYVVPEFGFVGDRDPNEPGETRPPREGYLQTYFAEYRGSPPDPETIDLGGVPIVSRTSRRGWVTVFNRGRTGHGFAFCNWCGYASDQRPARPKKGQRAPHAAPHSGTRECSGPILTIDLGHRYLTNVMELEVPLDKSSAGRDVAALSTLHGLIAALPVIGVSQGDVGGSLSVSPAGQRSIVMFDEVPGGAGHTRFVRDRLADLVAAAIERVGGCSCGQDTSCYGCLRTYTNQRDHDRLIRGASLEVLTALVGGAA
ncbi:MAG: DEAD/DEAH box helicase [Acidimicrobiales bacterium]